jgi:hypothetical protein
MSTTITFTYKQFEALKRFLEMMDDSERQHVAENFENYDETAENQLTHLNEIGAGETAFADAQRVWNAINKKDEDDETWSETCGVCGVLLGGKMFVNEEEFDEHPDREPGYNADGAWQCEKCRIKKEDEEENDDSDGETTDEE